MAWSQRQANGDARITMQVSADGLKLERCSACGQRRSAGRLRESADDECRNASHARTSVYAFDLVYRGKLSYVLGRTEDHTIGSIHRDGLDRIHGNDERHWSVMPRRMRVQSVINDAAPPLVSYRHTLTFKARKQRRFRAGSLTVPTFAPFRISKYAVGLNPNDTQNPGKWSNCKSARRTCRCFRWARNHSMEIT